MYRIGNAMDVHRLVENRKLFLGGVEIPYHLGLLGHSDADVLLHAICEAIIGALGKGDLGKHFPDKDPKYKDIDSKLLLKEVNQLMINEGYELVNLDASVLLEEPRLAPHISIINSTIASILGVELSQINVKAGTMEGLGIVGNKEGIIATCSVLIKKR
jgi:2-C-methyl-D-erythritol 2,4-cyclodiphosphate synthase